MPQNCIHSMRQTLPFKILGIRVWQVDATYLKSMFHPCLKCRPWPHMRSFLSFSWLEACGAEERQVWRRRALFWALLLLDVGPWLTRVQWRLTEVCFTPSKCLHLIAQILGFLCSPGKFTITNALHGQDSFLLSCACSPKSVVGVCTLVKELEESAREQHGGALSHTEMVLLHMKPTCARPCDAALVMHVTARNNRENPMVFSLCLPLVNHAPPLPAGNIRQSKSSSRISRFSRQESFSRTLILCISEPWGWGQDHVGRTD